MYTREVLKFDKAYNTADLRAIVKTDCSRDRGVVVALCPNSTLQKAILPPTT